MKIKTIGYWVATGLFCFAMFMGGIFHFWGGEETINQFSSLGLPLYFAKILGFWKLAGAITLLLPGMKLLKEWAYAGFLFNLTGAAAAHIFLNHELFELIAPLVLLGLGACSWYLRPASRKLDGLFC